ncbi:MAG: hypothetical protein MJE77_32375 [Proteobacteria bacterium]|nr:hypothetical protein [Pseudomonadota bacterium]
MSHDYSPSRRASDASDSLTIGNTEAPAPGKQPLTAKLAPPSGRVQQKARDHGPAPRPEQEGMEGRISSQDIMYELIAHKIGYEDVIGERESELLELWGYQTQWVAKINDAATGFFVGLIMPDADHPDLVPILVFRGTEGFRDVIADVHPFAVGHDQFSQNRQFVEQLISEAGGRVDVTGHSLGGALAQHAAAAFPGSINRVVTFQAPGVDASQARDFAEAADRPSVTHHIAGGDLVDTAGEEHLDGEVFRHTPGGGPLSHTKFLLTSPELQERREALGITDEVLTDLNIDKETNERPIERYEQYPHPVLNAVNETVRQGVGTVLYPVLSGVSILTRNDDKALRKQIDAASEDELAGYPVSERSYMVDRLCRGITGNGDEDAILRLLSVSAQNGDAVQVIDVVGGYRIAKKVHGSQYRELRTFYRAHYYVQTGQDEAVSMIQSCIDGLTAEWEEEMIADILVDRSDGRAIISRIGAIYEGGGFGEGLNKLQWQLDGGDQKRVDAVYAR